MTESPAEGVEIERKFLVDRTPSDLDAGTPIEQGYLVVGEDGVEVRVRRLGDATVLTVKSGPGMVRTEEEFAIDERRFASLWPLTEGRRLTKTRHVIPLHGDLVTEVDVYSGAHDGLVTAEIEFPSLEASEAFEPPTWLGREVTGDRRFAAQSLALNGRPPR
jgi:adenylate cyclase